ncbi:RIO1-domain-containing protein [Piedraia hortae CBS 480.64]|uniref:non-specific serine/threonine protein kinase n=1 Tax=Piedraia hortae CBS 480.64 TaxID=1314780 RepID=A0A6A7BS08_9PEZI|nr:RIO1-domain-containing protein [Piedraia hortae CBS 480.64]
METHEPPHRYIENRGYIDLDPDPQPTHLSSDDDIDIDYFEDDFSHPIPNHLKRPHDPTIGSHQKPKINTHATPSDHLPSLTNLRLTDREAGLLPTQSTQKDKSNHSTTESVLDPRTRLILHKFLDRNVITELHGVLSTGKEANVYHAIQIAERSEGGGKTATHTSPSPMTKHLAVKVYKTRILTFRSRSAYTPSRGGTSLSMIQHWAEREVRHLKRLHAHSVPCPEPILLKSHIIVMSFIGNNGVAAPRLKDVDLTVEEWKGVYFQTLMLVKRMWMCRLVHADLSEWNLLYEGGRVVVIDLGQGVDRENANALGFLRNDLETVTSFFGRKGVQVRGERAVFGFVVEDGGDCSEDGMRVKLEGLEARGIGDEGFKDEFIPRRLNEVDGEVERGGIGNLLPKDEGGDEQEGESEDDEGEFVEREHKPRGKRFEDKEAKKQHKMLVKEEKREQRKHKMPKHVKKQLVSSTSRGKR